MAARLKLNYTELRKAIENQHYGKVVRIANRILGDDEDQVKAWQCKLTAVIHLENFSDGLQALKRCRFVDQLLFEKAYCEYRLNESNEAWKTLSEAPPNASPRIRELKAQILYRLERYEECYAIYRDLIKTTSDPFDQERLTNLSAVAVNRAMDGVIDLCPAPSKEATYEHQYNYGCDLLASGKMDKALKALQQAESLCRAVLIQQDGASEEEVLEEVAVLRAQQAYCMQKLGKEKEALVLYNNILKNKPDDFALLAIINNNIAAINREANIFDTKKRMKSTIGPELEHKLTSKQRGSITLNRCLMAYMTHQDDVCETELAKLKSSYPTFDLQTTIVKAALLGRAKKLTEVGDVLKSYADKNPENALMAILSAAQILLTNGAKDPSLEVLLALRDSDKFCLGIVAAIITLCCDLGKDKEAEKILGQAVKWHQVNKSAKTSTMAELWQNAANFHLRMGNPRDAATALESLRVLNPKDINSLAQLIQAYSEFNTDLAQELSKQLPSAMSTMKTLDADVLEASVTAKYIRKKGHEIAKENTTPELSTKKSTPVDAAKTKKKKKKKKRRVCLPKNMVPGSVPDPERWMPRWQRKGFRAKRSRRNKEVGTGTQGMGIAGETMDKYDITKTSHARPTAQAASPQADTGARRQQWKKPVGKKKKK